MTAFAYELASVLQAQEQACPGHPDGAYALPWYLVIGEPGSGRSTAIRALNLSWPRGDGPLQLSVPDQQCSYWMPDKAVFVEPEARVSGTQRQQGLLQELCEELLVKRSREPIDGIILVASAQLLADATEDGVDDYAKAVRRELIEVSQTLAADVPVYVVVTAVDALWGFGDVFRWTAERRDEGAWGFSLPPAMVSTESPERVQQELEGLLARVESMCFDKLSSEDQPEERMRAFQHLSEARHLMQRLRQFMHIVTMDNAFERAPWLRALAFGSGVPGTGQQLRYSAQRFAHVGFQMPQHSGTQTPGGMPLHPLLEAVLLPERDLVPTRVRWRDDKLLVLFMMIGVVAWLGIIIVTLSRWFG